MAVTRNLSNTRPPLFIWQDGVARSLASYCPTCKGLMRPQKGVLICIRCSAAGRARTVVAAGRRIPLAEGQQGLAAPTAPTSPGFDPTLTPHKPVWRPAGRGRPHPQLGLFPHDEIRDGQKRLTRDVTMAVQGGRHLVAHAPTGLGKTAATLAPALHAAIDNGKVVLFLTGRQSQHRIAVETLRMIAERRGVKFGLVDLVAKRDMCLRPEASDMHPARFPDFCARETRTHSCRYLGEVDPVTLGRVKDGVLHVEELMAVSKAASLCPHMVAIAAAKEARVVIADYNHLFSDIREQSLERLGLRLDETILIVDEAHNLPERIKNSHAHRVTAYLLDQVETEARSHKASAVQADIAALRETLASLVKTAESEGRAKERLGGDRRVVRLKVEDLSTAFELERNRSILGTHRTLENMVKDLGPLVTKVRKGTDAAVHAETLQEALEDWGRFRTGALRFLEWEAGSIALHIRLLDPGVIAKTVFDRVHSAVLMSGTLRPPEMVRDLLGLDVDRTTVRIYPNPFPPENRMIAVLQGSTTRFNERGDALWLLMAGHVADVARAARGNLAVFTPSYAVLRDIRLALEREKLSKEIIVEEPGWTKADRDRVLDSLEGARKRKGAILLGVLGGSFSEGVDFANNLLSAVIVVGLPLAPPDLEVEATIGHLETRFPGKGRLYGYTYPAMNRVLQAMGRGIRGPKDKCAIFLMDERFLGPPYKTILPQESPTLAVKDAAPVAAFLKAHGL